MWRGSMMFPLIVRALHEIEIVAMQFLRGGRIRVTVRSEAYREDLLSSEFRLEDTVVPVTPADCVAKSVYVRDLPFEVFDKSIVSAFSTYGKVYSVKSVYYNEFPAICTGTRIVLMSVNNPVLSVVNVHGFECRVWCPGQPAFCSVWRSSGHLPRACPLTGLCRRCKQPGHVARDCGQAWGQPRPSSSASVPSPSPSSSPADPVPDPVSTPSDPVPVTNPVPDDPSAPAPASVPSYPSITVDDHLRTRHVKRLELVTPEDGEVVMSSDLSVADASPPRRTRPRVPSSVDYKKLVRLFLPKVKLVQIRLLSKSCVYPWLKCIN